MLGAVAQVPTIDVEPLVRDAAGADAVARRIDAACRDHGFFSIVGHGIDPPRLDRLVGLAREFFARPEAEKAEIAMARAGRAWRGWFPVGGELTSGVPDHKEGIYFGAELGPDDPRVRAGLPLHGANLFPRHPAALASTVLDLLDDLTALGRHVGRGLALGLGLDPDWFARELTADPVVLFRIFHYPASRGERPDRASGWGVAEHTDYGLLTLLIQDDTGGLEVHTADGWTPVPPAPGAIVCNLGDMLDRMTGGRYHATPHRVRAPRSGDRISCPFFFDPSWDARVRPLPLGGDPPAAGRRRWDGTDLATLSGTYGDYLLGKVAQVFPELAAADPVHLPGPVGERP
jgi:isopenicillin N synthase-like dioxygenase